MDTCCALYYISTSFFPLTVTLLTVQSVVRTSWVMRTIVVDFKSSLCFLTQNFHFPSCRCCWMWLIFRLGSRSPSDLEQKENYCFNSRSLCKYNVFIFMLFHCWPTCDLSFNSFLTCKICSKYFSSSGILLVIFFVSSSLLFSALTDWSGSAHYVFFPFLSPSPPVLSSGWLLYALSSSDDFALLLF